MDERHSEAKIAFIDRLPNDMLLELLALFISDKPMLFHISHVCRFWKGLIHGTSRFWSRIGLFVDEDEADEKAAYWINHAGACPLTIKFSWKRGEDSHVRHAHGTEDVTVASIKRLATVIRGCLGFLQVLEIYESPYLLYHCFFDIFFDIVRGDTPVLQRLVIIDDTAGVELFKIPDSSPTPHSTSHLTRH
ncbi:hypothetical protein BOTBODRAFT_192174 [Botryobasidium botryosum FD-172 SS1]|uniref:F-box domain-containing protein n=1 Tax=Botryobasidium botryosum (strain FD-172 SS1) TaxID=930990 RepID=A0A067M8D7_BOTB1|nr:hypothetical protein BOTBODRAFT_192174 [Botryobasidium botryosum FD-172 SS1]